MITAEKMNKEAKRAVHDLNPEDLLHIFGERPGRMKLLDDSLQRIGINEITRILETGCSFGDGLAHACKMTGASGRGLDLMDAYVETAANRHGNLGFDCGSVYEMPYEAGSFDLAFSQAAFSLLTQKDRAVDELYRVLDTGGYIIINDFIAKEEVSSEMRDQMNFIPCFNSIGTLEDYVAFFEERGFKTILAEDRYSEIITTTLHLSKAYKCTPMEMAALFSSILGTGRNAEENCRCFFKKTRISYGQLIFQKTDRV